MATLITATVSFNIHAPCGAIPILSFFLHYTSKSLFSPVSAASTKSPPQQQDWKTHRVHAIHFWVPFYKYFPPVIYTSA
jgi:hypothetical protein